jgi:hypothetical protein
MIMLLALPILALVALAHRYLQVYAPSNLLIRRVRVSHPRLSAFALLVVLAGTLLAGMAIASSAVAAGAPRCLNLVVLVLAWDAIKVGWLAIAVLIRCCLPAIRRFVRRPAARPQVASYS